MPEADTSYPRRRWPSLLMLLLVAAGLFTMHTLGHFSVRATGATTHAGGVMPALGHDRMQLGVAVMAPDRLAQAATVGTGRDGPGMPMGPAAVCIAILCGLLVIAVAAAISRSLLHVIAPAAPMLRLTADAGRGPPRTGIGLLIADLSVARD